jgi:hypothetical protein
MKQRPIESEEQCEVLRRWEQIPLERRAEALRMPGHFAVDLEAEANRIREAVRAANAPSIARKREQERKRNDRE